MEDSRTVAITQMLSAGIDKAEGLGHVLEPWYYGTYSSIHSECTRCGALALIQLYPLIAFADHANAFFGPCLPVSGHRTLHSCLHPVQP